MKPYEHKAMHKCFDVCKLCKNFMCERTRPFMCPSCNMECRSNACFARHNEAIHVDDGEPSSICKRLKRCLDCLSIIHLDKHSFDSHKCGECTAITATSTSKKTTQQLHTNGGAAKKKWCIFCLRLWDAYGGCDDVCSRVWSAAEKWLHWVQWSCMSCTLEVPELQQDWLQSASTRRQLRRMPVTLWQMCTQFYWTALWRLRFTMLRLWQT